MRILFPGLLLLVALIVFVISAWNLGTVVLFFDDYWSIAMAEYWVRGLPGPSFQTILFTLHPQIFNCLLKRLQNLNRR